MAKPATKAPGIPRESGALSDRKPRAERWQELLGAAAKVFYEKGYDAASLQEIADRVGILKGSIYYYIKTKSDLRDSLLYEVHSEGLAMIRKAATVEGDAIDKLDAMIRGHIDYACRKLIETTVYLRELKRLTHKERADLLGNQGYREVFLHVIEEGQREGTIQPDLDPKLTAQSMVAMLNSIAQWYQPASTKQRTVVSDHFVAVLLRGHATIKALKKHGVAMK